MRKAGSVQPFQYRLSELQKATNNFSDRNKLGSGGSGVVYKGKVNGTTVAIKKLHGSSVEQLIDIANEVSLLCSLEHDNLVKLLGFCSEAGHYLLIYEFIQNGSLSNYLNDDSKRKELNWVTRFNIINGIARGLYYLHHDLNDSVIHRDLKPENVLLDENHNAKIADFGLSKSFDKNKTHNTTRMGGGTPGYFAPEICYFQLYSPKSDVYNFGLLILEIIAGCTIPLYASRNSECLPHVMWRQWKNNSPLINVIDQSIRDVLVQDQIKRCIQIGLLCIQNDHRKRPDMKDVLKMLTTTSYLPAPDSPGFRQGEYVGSKESISSHVEFRLTEDPSSCIEFQSTENATTSNQLLQPTVLTKLYSLQDVMIATNNFSTQLSSALHCKAYRGALDGEAIVVEQYFLDGDVPNIARDTVIFERAKVLKCFSFTKRKIRRDILLPKMRHPNIVNVLGYCSEVSNKLFVVFKHPREGVLSRYLSMQRKFGSFQANYSAPILAQNNTHPREWSTVDRIIKGIAKGISYLHHGLEEKYLIHGNLNPSTIWLDDSWNAQLSCFSLARVLDMNESFFKLSSPCGALGYTAPEIYSDLRLTTNSDVYSYGIILLRLLVDEESGYYFTDFNTLYKVWNKWQQNKMLELLDQRIHNWHPEEALCYFQIALLCIQGDPDKRPNMQEVVKMLTCPENLPIPTAPVFRVQHRH